MTNTESLVFLLVLLIEAPFSMAVDSVLGAQSCFRVIEVIVI